MFTHDYVRPLDIGNQLAENDGLLRDHFIDIQTNRFVGHGDHSIILGRKGAGKSALRLHFQRTTTQNQRAFSIQPSSEDLHDAFLYLVDQEKAPFSVEFMASLWEITVYLNLTRLAYSDQPSSDVPQEFSVFPEQLADDIRNDSRYGLGRTLELIGATYPDLASRRRLARALRAYTRRVIPNNGFEYYVLVDSVDDILHNSLDTTRRNDLFATFFEGLLSFFQNFTNSEQNPLASCVRMHLFIPIDIYNWSVSRHADKLRSYKHAVTWEPSQLDAFITSRMTRNLPLAQQGRLRNISDHQDRMLAIWNTFFPGQIKLEAYSQGRVKKFQVDTRELLIDMTLRRPRDLQEIVSLIDLFTRSAHLSFPTEAIIFQALDQYSSDLKQSVEKEFDVVFPALKDILSQLSGNTPNIQKNTLMELVGRVVGQKEKKIYDAMNIMYNACFIGAVRRTGYANNRSVIFYYDFQDFSTIWMHDEFAVHRAFWHALHLVSLRSGRSYF
jgi:hypothetical protein